MRLLRFAFFATLSLILTLQMRGLDEPLHTDDTRGIVAYELAWSQPRAAAIITDWQHNDAIEAAKVSLGVDFAFLVAYPLMFAFGAALLVRTPASSTFQRIGATLSKAVLLCIPLDLTENLALWHMLDAGASDALAHLAAICAALKFTIVIITALWCIAAIGARITSPSTSGS